MPRRCRSSSAGTISSIRYCTVSAICVAHVRARARGLGAAVVVAAAAAAAAASVKRRRGAALRCTTRESREVRWRRASEWARTERALAGTRHAAHELVDVDVILLSRATALLRRGLSTCVVCVWRGARVRVVVRDRTRVRESTGTVRPAGCKVRRRPDRTRAAHTRAVASREGGRAAASLLLLRAQACRRRGDERDGSPLGLRGGGGAAAEAGGCRWASGDHGRLHVAVAAA